MTNKERATRITTLATNVEYALDQDDHLGVLRNLGRMADFQGELAWYISQKAYNAGVPKTKIAQALGISVSMLRPMNKQVAS